MILKEILNTELYGNLIDISDRNRKSLIEMIDDMRIDKQISPSQFYHNHVKDKFKQLEESLLKEYPIEIVHGNRTKNFLITSLFTFRMVDYIQKRYKLKVNFKNSQMLLDYNYDLYKTITAITIAMILTKYKASTLYREHIIFLCIKVLFTYFKLYEGTTYLV